MSVGNDTPPGVEHDDTRSRAVAVALLAVGGLTQAVFGIAAIGGLRALEDNVQEIESNPNFGHLYLGLTGWGVLLLLAGAAQIGAARAVRRGSPVGRVLALGAALAGLGLGFFTLAIFHAATFGPLAISLASLYVLSYRVDDGT